eukprot:384525-Pelagomonas_calceolata.AAC.1
MEKLAWRTQPTCMREQGMVCYKKVCCCPRHCISMTQMCQEGLGSSIFQLRLRRFPNLSLLIWGVFSLPG